MNKKEELAEYIIRNLIFIVLFILFAFYSISSLLLPAIQRYQECSNDLKYTQFSLSKALQENQALQTQIQTIQKQNHFVLDLLQKGVSADKIQSIAEDFFQTISVKTKEKTEKTLFKQTSYEIKGISNGVKPIFDFVKKIKQTFPNIAFSLPFIIEKTDPFASTLRVEIILHSTQTKQKEANK